MKYIVTFKDGRSPIKDLTLDQLTDWIVANPQEAGNFKPNKQLKSGEAADINPQREVAGNSPEKGKTRKEKEESLEDFKKTLNLGQQNLINTGYREIVYKGGAWGLVKTNKGGEEPIFSSVALIKDAEDMKFKNLVKRAVSENMANICMTAKLLDVEVWEEDVVNYIESKLK